MPPIRILIVAEPLLYGEGLGFLLRAERRIEVVDATADGSTALARAVAVRADVVLVDMHIDGAQTIVRSIAEAAPTCSVGALGKVEGHSAVMVCLEAGAAGYLPPNGSLSDLRECINAASRGEISCSPRIAAHLARRVARLAAELRAEQPPPPLTLREAEILELIDQGLSNKEMALRLCIQVPTVKHHVHNILEKLQVTHRGEAAARARRGAAGILSGNEMALAVERDGAAEFGFELHPKWLALGDLSLSQLVDALASRTLPERRRHLSG